MSNVKGFELLRDNIILNIGQDQTNVVATSESALYLFFSLT